jgi:hypothetical protein
MADFFFYDLFTSSLLSQTKVTLVVREPPLVALFLVATNGSIDKAFLIHP